MFIVWGTRINRAYCGRVADFCGVCRLPRAFTVKEVKEQPHLYWIPTGRGNRLGYEMTCTQCKNTIGTDVSEYATITTDPNLDIDGLIELTHPNLIETIEQLADREARATSGKLTEDERISMLAEPFISLNPAVETRAATIHMTPGSIIGAIFLLFVPMTLWIMGTPTPTTHNETLKRLAIVALVGGCIYTLYVMVTDVRRFIRRKILPQLVGAIAPYEPTDDEIREVLAQLKNARLAIGKRLSPQRMISALQDFR